MHWKTAQKLVKNTLHVAGHSMRAGAMFEEVRGQCAQTAFDKALASLVKSGVVTCNRGWYAVRGKNEPLKKARA